MVKYNRRMLTLFSISVLLVFLFTGCDSSGSSSSYDAVDSVNKSAVNYNIVDTESAVNTSNDAADTSNEESQLPEERKIIQKYNYNVETKEYDKLIKDLTEQINTLGGYIESSTMYGTGYDSSKSARNVTYVIRVPKKSTDQFVNFISENSIVTSKEMTTEDVTLKYVDVESRLNALKTEKESLEKLLSSATTVTDTITVRDRLTTVIYEIESYTSQLKTYDNQIEYTTITINVEEVEQPTVVKEQTMLQEIVTKFSDNLQDVAKGIRTLVIWFISSIPYFIIYVVMIALILVITKFITKRLKRDKMIHRGDKGCDTTDTNNSRKN